MDTSTLPVVTMAGQALSGGSWVDPSPAPKADATYARVFTAPVPAGTKLGSTLPVSVTGAVNYAGRALEPAWTGDVTIAPRATQILLDYEGAVPHVAGTTRDVAVHVLDASGKPLEGASVIATVSNAKLATVVGTSQKTNDAGGTTVSVQALLPGTCKLTFAVEGTGLSRTVDLVSTLEANCVVRPGAAFASTTVTRTTTPKASYYVLKGTELSLATETEDAVVYYSTDGSDPASVATRKAYESPLKLSANTLVRAVAYKDGMEFSEELALNFKMRKSIAQATVAAIKAKSYTGKALAPKPTVKMGTTTLKLGTDYTLAYKNNVKAGTATITITGKGKYTSTKKVTFKINKATNPLTASATTREALYKSVKQKAVVVARPLAVSKNQGKVTYAKASGSAAFAVNKTTGKVTIKKGTKKGTYTIKIKVTAAGNANYKAGSKTIACKVVVADKYTNPMAVSAVARTAKLATLKKQAVTVAAPLKFATKAQGKVTYAKASGSAAFAVNKTTGKVTIKKGTKKGTYTIKIKVAAAGNTSYKAATKTVTCKITIK
jgi:rRNA maturation protein Nop10